MNINKSFINSLSFSGKETTYFDDTVKGFGVRVCKSSASYILMYRNAYGRQKKLTICKTTLMTPTEARDEAKRLLALVVQGKDPEQEKLERRKELTIGELADEFLKFKLPFLKQATRNSYQSAVKKHIKPDLGKIPIKAFRHSDAQRYYNDLLMGKGITTFHSGKEDFRHIGSANTVLVPLRCMFDYARSLGLVDFNPVKELQTFPNPCSYEFFDEAEIRKLGRIINTCNYVNPYYLNVIRLLVMTGCRKKEIENLKWSYIDFKHQLFLFPDTKTGAQDRPFGIAVKELLLQMKDAVQPQSNDEFVFPKSGKGTDVAKNFFQVHVKSKPEFAKKKVHSLRHTFASMAAAIGFPEAVVAKLLGHKQQSMTARYTHLTEDAVQQAADKITRRIAALLNIPEQCAKPEDVKMFPRGIHLYKLHLVKPEEYPRPIPSRKQRAAG